MSDLFKNGKKLIDNDIIKVEISFINFSGKEDIGILEVHKDVKDEVVKIFKEIKEIKFPIFKMINMTLMMKNQLLQITRQPITLDLLVVQQN